MLLGELDLNAAPAVGALSKLDSKMGGTMSGLSALGESAGLAVGGLGALGAVVAVAAAGLGVLFASTNAAMNFGGVLNDMSLRTGEGVGQLTILGEAFKEAGLGAEGVEPFLLKLQGALGGVNEEGGKTTAAFDALKVSAAQLNGMDAIGQIQALQKGFAGIADQGTKVQVARNLFGKSGGQALSLLGDSSVLDDARKKAGPLAETMEKNVGAFDALGDSIGALKIDFLEFGSGALSQIAPPLKALVDTFSSINFTGMGEGLGLLTAKFLELANVVAGPLAGAANAVSSISSAIFGSGSKDAAGSAPKYAGMAKAVVPDAGGGGGGGDGGGGDKTPMSALQKIGGGGLGSAGGDPALSEARAHTNLLREIRDKLPSGKRVATSLDHVPV